MFGSLDPGIKQAMKLVPPACKLEADGLLHSVHPSGATVAQACGLWLWLWLF